MQLILGGAPVTAAHGCCYICRHFSNPKEWVDTGADIEFEGSLVICRNCAEAIAQVIAWLPPDATAKLKDANAQLREQNRKLKAKADAYDIFIVKLDETRVGLS